MAGLYTAVYYIDIDQDRFEQISCKVKEIEQQTGTSGSVRNVIRMYVETTVGARYRRRMEEFFDLDTLRISLKQKGVLTAEYESKLSRGTRNWIRIIWKACSWNEEGQITHVLLFAENMDNQQERLKQVNAAFLNNVFHSIRTPINVILGFSAMGERHLQEPEQVQKYMQRITSAASELLSLMNHMADVPNREKALEEAEETIEEVREHLRGHRVLVVDDVALNREITEEILKEAGMQVEMAVNGQEAVRKVEAAPGYYDLILMDIMMPVMDGYEATRQIRSMADPRAAGTPIIAITANVFEEDRIAARKAGMDEYLEKPFRMECLYKLMEHYMV